MHVFRSLVSLFILPLAVVAADAERTRGYPLYFGSFGEVGESEIEGEVRSVQYVDDRITAWTKGCPADAFVLIKDSTPFQLTGLKKMQRLAENSLTRGSYLTDFVLNLHELALDLEEYCDGNLYEVSTSTNATALPKPIDTTTRVFYIEFDKDATTAAKDETLSEVLSRLSTPFVTVLYTSTFQQAHPILRSVQINPRRVSWEKANLKHKRDHIAPVIAPLFSRGKSTGHAAPESSLDLPDNFFLTLFIGSVLGVGLLAYRDVSRWLAGLRKPAAPSSPGKAPQRISGTRPSESDL